MRSHNFDIEELLDQAFLGRSDFDELRRSLPNQPQKRTYNDMSETRLNQLESRMGSVENRLDRIEGKLDRIGEVLTDIRVELAKKPDSNELRSWKIQWIAIGVASFALIVGSVIGGLGWIASLMGAIR